MLGPTVFGYGTPVEALFPPDFWAALQQEVRPPDVERAKALMAEAGSRRRVQHDHHLLVAVLVPVERGRRPPGAVAADRHRGRVEPGRERDDGRSGLRWHETYDIAVTGESAYVDPNTLILPNFKSGRERQLRQLLQPGGRRADRAGDRYHRSGRAGQDLPGDSDDPSRGSPLDQPLRRQPVRGDEDQRQGLRPHPDRLQHRLPHDVDRGVRATGIGYRLSSF